MRPKCFCLLVVLTACAPPIEELKPLVFPNIDHFDTQVQTRLRNAFDDFRVHEQLSGSKEAAARYGRLGMVFSAHHLQESAAICYANAAGLDQTSSKWPYLLGFANQEMGLSQKAIDAYDIAIKRQPDFSMAKLRKALILSETNPEAARAILENLSPGDNADITHAALGRIALSAQHYTDAATHFEKALTISPHATQLHAPLALAYRGLGRTEEAQQQLALLGQGELLLRDGFTRELAELSGSAQLYLARGLELAREQRYDAAIKQFSRAIDLNPTDANAHASQAMALDATGDTAAALIHVKKAIALDENLAAAHFHFANLIERTVDDETAESSYVRAVTLDPEYMEAQLSLGHLRMRLADYTGAKTAYQQARLLNPNNTIVLYRYALSLVANNECQAAETHLSHAVSLDSRLAPIIQAWARVSSTCDKSDVAAQRRALADAKILYDARANIEHAELYAMALAANGQFAEAVSLQNDLVTQAKRQGVLDQRPDLTQNLSRYKNKKTAKSPWHENAKVFKPQSHR